MRSIIAEINEKKIWKLIQLESRKKEGNDLNGSVIEAFHRLEQDAFQDLITKLVKSMGLEITNSVFEEDWAKFEANIGSKVQKADYDSYLIKFQRKTDKVTPEDVQDFVRERKSNEKGMIFISTSGFSEDARRYAKEFDVEIADNTAVTALLVKFDLLDEVMIQWEKEILKGEKGRYLPSVEELENVIELGKSAYAKGRLEEALRHFSHATELKPKYDAAWILKGVVLSDLKKYEMALDAFLQALKINLENPKAWFSMGTTLYSLGRYEEELECYAKALEIKPDFLDAWNNMGATLLHLEKYEEAQKTYDEILKLDPEFKLAWNNKGIALKKLKRIEEALECYTNAINIDSRYIDAWLNRGIIYLNEKRFKEAYICFDAVLKLNDKNIQAYYHMAKTFEGVGQYSRAIKIYDKIIELDPKFNPAKRRKKKATKYLQQKGDSQVEDNFFVLTKDEAREYHLFSPEPVKGRILVQKTVEAPEVQVKGTARKEISTFQSDTPPKEPEEYHIIPKYEDIRPSSIEPTQQKPDQELDLEHSESINQPYFSQESEAILDKEKELKEKEHDLIQMETWLRERYFTIENERKELKNIRTGLEKKKESIENERIRAQRIAEELQKRANRIAKSEEDIQNNKKRLVLMQEDLERERRELLIRSENMTRESQGSVEDRIAIERDIVKLELREKEITAANKVLVEEREKVEKESIALKNEMEKMISARAELEARERSIIQREEEIKKRFDKIVNKSGDMAIKEKELEEMAKELKRTQDKLEKRTKALKENERRLLEKQKLLADNRARMKEDIPPKPPGEERENLFDEIISGKVKPVRKKSNTSVTSKGVLSERSDAPKPQIMQSPSLSMTLDFESVERELIAGELESIEDILKMYSVGQMDSAQKRVFEARENGLASKLIWNIEGNIFRQKKEYKKAIECYNNALKRDQNYVVTLVNLMSLYYDMVHYEDALKVCNKILLLRSFDEKFILFKALLEARLGQSDDAITTIDNLLLDNNRLEVVWNLKGILLYNLNQEEDALECFEEALKLNSENLSAMNNKGVILHNKGKFREALKLFEHASKKALNEKIKNNIKLTSKKLGNAEEVMVPEVVEEEIPDDKGSARVEKELPAIQEVETEEIKEESEKKVEDLEKLDDEPGKEEISEPVVGERSVSPKEESPSKDVSEKVVGESYEEVRESKDIELEPEGKKELIFEEQQESEEIESSEKEVEPESETEPANEPIEEGVKESVANIFSELGKISEAVEEDTTAEIEPDMEDVIPEESEEEETEPSTNGSDIYMCPSCGSFVSPSAEKCEQCGYNFEEDEEELEFREQVIDPDLIRHEDDEFKDSEEEVEQTKLEPEDKIREDEEEKQKEIERKTKKGAPKKGKGIGDKEVQKKEGKKPSKKEAMERFTQISGVGASKAEALYEAGFDSYDSLRSAKVTQIGDVKGIGSSLAKKIKEQLKKKKFKDE